MPQPRTPTTISILLHTLRPLHMPQPPQPPLLQPMLLLLRRQPLRPTHMPLKNLPLFPRMTQTATPSPAAIANQWRRLVKSSSRRRKNIKRSSRRRMIPTETNRSPFFKCGPTSSYWSRLFRIFSCFSSFCVVIFIYSFASVSRLLAPSS